MLFSARSCRGWGYGEPPPASPGWDSSQFEVSMRQFTKPLCPPLPGALFGGVGMNVCALIDPKSVTPGRSNVIFITWPLLLQTPQPKAASRQT